jgi:hypothetical protein
MTISEYSDAVASIAAQLAALSVAQISPDPSYGELSGAINRIQSVARTAHAQSSALTARFNRAVESAIATLRSQRAGVVAQGQALSTTVSALDRQIAALHSQLVR